MAGHKVVLKGPGVVKEICIGIVLGLCVASMWKKIQWEGQRKTKSFYDSLEKGEISIVPQE